MADVNLSDEVKDILSRSTIEGNNLTLPDQLDRKSYMAVDKALKTAGGKWNRSAKAHVFKSDPREILGLVLSTGVVIDKKKALQAFYTPPELAERVVALADVKGHTVLEPSAGDGALAIQCRDAGASRVLCVEIDESEAEVLKKQKFVCLNIDFLKLNVNSEHDLYDRIVMNPPFTRGTDIKHILHAAKFLKPGGKLVAICAGGPKQEAALRSWAEDSGGTWEEIPAGAFKSSGTNISTVLLSYIKGD